MDVMDINKFINQQYGITKWRSYDSVLHRFQCSTTAEFRHILPDVDADTDSPIFACRFCENPGYRHLVALANEDGRVAIYNTLTGERYGHTVHDNAIFDVAWLPQQMQFVAASGDNCVSLVSCDNGSLQTVRYMYGHCRSVKTVACCKEDPNIFCSGSRDGNINVWDIRSPQMGVNSALDRIIPHSHVNPVKVLTPSSRRKLQTGASISGFNSVTCVVFSNSNTIISCGAGDGYIKAWDLRKTYSNYIHDLKVPQAKHVIPYSGITTRCGFTNLLIDGSRLYASCLDNVIYCYSLSDYDPNPIARYTGHQNSSFYVKSCLSADGQYLLSGSSDQYAYIWNVMSAGYNQYQQTPLVRLKGHTAEVTCVAWSAKGGCPFDETIITCSDDLRHRHWKMGEEFREDFTEIDVGGWSERVVKTAFRKKRKYYWSGEPVTAFPTKKLRHNVDILVHGSCLKRDRNHDDSMELDVTCSPARKKPRRLFTPLENSPPTITIDATTSPLRSPSQRKRKFVEMTMDADGNPFSPTTNLPNFVVDGCAPHVSYSPQKRKTADWLTKFRTERRIVREMQALTTLDPNADTTAVSSVVGSTTPKTPRLDAIELTSRRGGSSTTPRRRNSTTANSVSTASQRNLLSKFFRITNCISARPNSPKANADGGSPTHARETTINSAAD